MVEWAERGISILPVDQGIEHTAGSSFTQIPYTLILKIA
jgi:hypothetical protein